MHAMYDVSFADQSAPAPLPCGPCALRRSTADQMCEQVRLMLQHAHTQHLFSRQVTHDGMHDGAHVESKARYL